MQMILAVLVLPSDFGPFLLPAVLLVASSYAYIRERRLELRELYLRAVKAVSDRPM